MRLILDAAPRQVKCLGLDIARAAVDACARTCPEADIINASVYQMPLMCASLDLITCIEVLEHLLKPKRALDEMLRVLRPTGRLAISVPDGDFDDWEWHNNYWNVSAFRDFLVPYCVRVFERIGQTFFVLLSK